MSDNPTQPAPELPDDTISFPFNGKIITIAVGNNVGINAYILPLEDFTPEWQAVLLGENPPSLTCNKDKLFAIFTARSEGCEHLFFIIVGDALNGNGRLERFDPAELILSRDYRKGKGDDTAAKGGNAAEATP